MESYIKKQLEEGYNAKLNVLFAEWKASYKPEDNAKNRFCPDGLVLKYKDEESGYDINKKWEEAERKIMFIVKDCPDEWGYDTRRLFVGYPDNEKSLKNAEKARNIKGRSNFLKNIANILYGLWVMTQENKGDADAFKNIDNNKRLEAFADIPFAYVEAKKLAGRKSCPNVDLQKALDQDGHFLAKEIEILQPNIIVCFEKNGRIFNSIIKNYLNGKAPDDKWEYKYEAEGEYHGFDCKLYYYEDEGLLLFNSYHPSYSYIEEWKIYEKVISPLRQYFERYRTFDYLLTHKK